MTGESGVSADATLADATIVEATFAEERSRVVELRRYTLRPGAREALIALFDRALVETQEAAGMRVIGQFRDLDEPDSFVWMRGFPDMARRTAALGAFYGGPAWKAHRDAANAAMTAFDDVLLLKPLAGDLGLAERAPPGATGTTPGLVAVTTFHLRPHGAATFPVLFARQVGPAMAECGGPVAATFVTEPSANGYPALPVREDEAVLVALARFADAGAHAAYLRRLAEDPRWRALEASRAVLFVRPPQVRRLAPTARSRLR